MQAPQCRLFVYGTLLVGESEHDSLSTSELQGPAATEPGYHLVDLGAGAALVSGGTTSVLGELYHCSLETRARLDVLRQVPILYKRVTIFLDDGLTADAYVLEEDQARGRRRLHHGDWRKRFTRDRPSALESPFARWARNRF